MDTLLASVALVVFVLIAVTAIVIFIKIGKSKGTRTGPILREDTDSPNRNKAKKSTLPNTVKTLKKGIQKINDLSIYDLPAPYDLGMLANSDVTSDDVNERLGVISDKLQVSQESLQAFLSANKAKNTSEEKLSSNLIESSKRSLELQRDIMSSRASDPDVIKNDNDALKSLSEGRIKQAESFLERSEEILTREAKNQGNDPNKLVAVADKRAQRAEVNRIGYNFQRAGNHYNHAHKMVPEEFKEKKLDYLLRAGDSYSNAELYDDALALSEAALADAERAFGKSHPYVAKSLNNLGKVLVQTKRYDRAITAFQRALSILEETSGKNTIDVGKTLTDIADTYVVNKELNKAVPTYQRSLGIFEKKLGPVNDLAVSTLNNLVNTLRLLKRYGEGEEILKKYLDHLNREKKNPTSEIKMAIVCNSLALLYLDSSRMTEARPYFERSLKIIESVHGPEHPELARTLNNLANTESKDGDYVRATNLLRRALRVVKSNYPENHPNVMLVKKNFSLAANKAHEMGLKIHEKK